MLQTTHILFIIFNFENLNPINQLILSVGTIGFGFLLLVIYLDNSRNFALKRDWRKKEETK